MLCVSSLPMQKITNAGSIYEEGGSWSGHPECKFVSYLSLGHSVGIELWIKAILSANMWLPLGMSGSVTPCWEGAKSIAVRTEQLALWGSLQFAC